jgi:hypothetical protein
VVTMMSKKVRLFILGVCSLGLSSCVLPIRPVYAIRQETAAYNLPAEYNMGTISYTKANLPLGYEPIDKTLPELKDGFILIKDTSNGHVGAFSPLLDKIIVPADYSSIDLLQSTDNGVYLKAHKNGSFDVFDFLGYSVVSGILDSASFSIEATKFTLPCEVVKLVEEYRVNGDVNLRSIESDRSRIAFSYPSFMFARDGYSFLASSFDLASVGLAGYSGALDAKGIFTVTHGEIVCSTVDVAASPDVRLCFWKAFFSQENEIVASDDYDYSMDISGEETYFKVMTKQIALVNGETKDLSVSYLIEDIRPMYDENMQAHYALAYAFPIVDKHLASDLSIYVINNEGEITYDATADAAYQYGTSFITPYKMYDSITGSLIDFDFKVVGTVLEPVVAHNSSLEILKTETDGVSHLYGYEGQPLIADGYSYLSVDSGPYSTIYGVTASGASVFLDPFTKATTSVGQSANQTVTDRGFATLRLDTQQRGAITNTTYSTYSGDGLSSFDAVLLSSGASKTYLARFFTDAYRDSATNTYSFFSAVCQY